MLFFGFVELLVILLIGGGAVYLLASRQSTSSSPPPTVATGMQLNCPSCGKETAADRPTCQHCGTDL